MGHNYWYYLWVYNKYVYINLCRFVFCHEYSLCDNASKESVQKANVRYKKLNCSFCVLRLNCEYVDTHKERLSSEPYIFIYKVA